ncbi:MAG: SDR family NAD(P)-dependent oxidoreductase [Candidatus Synoicihabitans palmerolidicus]|nr:SDR family NAD(P)-dependent oxidoreductase [Candidatus Synoicihabitans palmerolidicus]
MSAPSFNLSGRRALVTGSFQGIGLALARSLAAQGAEVIFNGRDATKLSAVAAHCASDGLAVTAHAFDVSDESAVTAAIGPIDILFNNDGIHRRGPLATMALTDWQAVLDTNLTSAFLGSRAFVPAMIERQ